MTDKIQKILDEIQTRKLCTMDEHMAFYSKGAEADYKLLSKIEELIKSLQEEPVSEELEEAAKRYATEGDEISGLYIIDVEAYAFKAGAKWQLEQFEKNRLTACDKQTEEEAEIERDFCMGIIENEHRQPTFDDAIKYGMRLKEKEIQSTIELAEDHAMLAGMEKMKEEMMSKAIEGEVGYWNSRGLSVNVDLPLSADEGDKVKVILIEED